MLRQSGMRFFRAGLLAGSEDVLARDDDVSVCPVAVGVSSDAAIVGGDSIAECRPHNSSPIAQMPAPAREYVNFIVIRPCVAQKPGFPQKPGLPFYGDF